VTAHDAESGKQLWRFYTVPGNPANGFENDAMRMAADLGRPMVGAWRRHGLERDHLRRGRSTGSIWARATVRRGITRSGQGKGDNLFLSSIVALDRDTGAHKYQTNPGESWDFNANMDYATRDAGYRRREAPVLMTAPKNGFRTSWIGAMDSSSRPGPA
jgi:quinohemoprotein ethanol dehydrogenase